jgi:phosphomannomutase
VIRSGSSGWRGTFGDEITVAAVRRLAAGVARHLLATKTAARGVVVGYDARFLSARLARAAGETLAALGVPAQVASAPMPTAAVAQAVVAGRRSLGVALTAGAAPAETGGILLIGPDGAPAGEALQQAIERQAAIGVPNGVAAAGRPAPRARRAAPARRAALRSVDPWPGYLRHLARSARRSGARRSRLAVVCDARGGAAAGRFAAALGVAGHAVARLNDAPHPSFAEGGPDCAEPQLAELARAVRREAAVLGLAVDGDGGRFGVVDRGGAAIPANLVVALLAEWLLEHGLPPGALARTVATTHLVDDLARRDGRVVVETPVGFAHLAPFLADRSAALACEEDGGLALGSHLPLRDGLFAALLVVAMTAARRASLAEQARALFARVGARHGRRIDYHVDAAARARMLRRLEDPPAVIGGRRVAALDAPDGPRVTFEDGSWLLVRDAAADHVARCHLETRTRADLDAITNAVRELLGRA